MKYRNLVVLPLILSWFMVNVCCLINNWPSLSLQFDTAFRTQRDISKKVSINDVSGFGVSVNKQVFDRFGYTTLALANVSALLSSGVEDIMVDFYWNEFTQKWQLCPGPFPANASEDLSRVQDVVWNNQTFSCQAGLTTDELMDKFTGYFMNTNTNLKANMVQLLVNLRTIRIDTKQKNSTTLNEYIKQYQSKFLSSIGNLTLNETLCPLGATLMTPSDVRTGNLATASSASNFYNNTKTAFPTLETFLLSDYKRVFAVVFSSDLGIGNSSYSYNISKADQNMMFVPGTNIHVEIATTLNSSLLQQCNETLYNETDDSSVLSKIGLDGHFRYVVDTDTTRFTNKSFLEYVQCGYSPILNSSNYNVFRNTSNSTLPDIVNNFLPKSLWSWSESMLLLSSGSFNASDDDLDVDNDNDSDDDNDNDNNEQDSSKVAYKCVKLTSDGWTIDNCYKRHRYACKNRKNPFKWYISSKLKKNYFNAYSDGECPDNYKLGTPQLSYETIALYNYIYAHDIQLPVWIDVNDITVTNCFVSGGPYAQCPYQKYVTKLKLVGLIAPGFVVSVVILILLIAEKLVRTNPIQTNRRRHWRKVINEYNKKNSYEGVPS